MTAGQRRLQDRSRRWWSRTLLTLLLLLAQAAAPAAPPLAGSTVDSATLALPGGGVICHADAALPPGPSQDTPQPLDGHRHDCTLCPSCQLALAPVPLLPGGAALPAPTVMLGRSIAAPDATGPPSPTRLAARPRGPPRSAV